MSRRIVIGCVLALAACKKAAPPPPAPVAAPVAIFLDDREVATSAALTVKPRALVGMAPGAPDPEVWLAVIALDPSGKATTVMAPARDHGDLVPSLALVDGAAVFGMARGDALENTVSPVVKVIIKTKDDRGAIAAELAGKPGGHGGGDGDGHQHDGAGQRPAPSADLVILIKSGKDEARFTGDKLAPLPTVTAPVGDTETPGWNFVDVLAAAGLGGAKAVNLTDSEGASLRLEGADFDPAQTVLYIKLNRSGQLRFRRFGKQGATWTMTGELRGIASIAVVPAS
ncbi:MAG: hypothetical protein R3B06_07565 [Kofleriaceae bacterium]